MFPISPYIPIISLYKEKTFKPTLKRITKQTQYKQTQTKWEHWQLSKVLNNQPNNRKSVNFPLIFDKIPRKSCNRFRPFWRKFDLKV